MKQTIISALMAAVFAVTCSGFNSDAETSLPGISSPEQLDQIQSPLIVILVTTEACHRPCASLSEQLAAQQKVRRQYVFASADSETVGMPSWQSPGMMAYIPGIGPVYAEGQFSADPANVDAFLHKLDAFFNNRVELAMKLRGAREALQEIDKKIEELKARYAPEATARIHELVRQFVSGEESLSEHAQFSLLDQLRQAIFGREDFLRAVQDKADQPDARLEDKQKAVELKTDGAALTEQRARLADAAKATAEAVDSLDDDFFQSSLGQKI